MNILSKSHQSEIKSLKKSISKLQSEVGHLKRQLKILEQREDDQTEPKNEMKDSSIINVETTLRGKEIDPNDASDRPEPTLEGTEPFAASDRPEQTETENSWTTVERQSRWTNPR